MIQTLAIRPFGFVLATVRRHWSSLASCPSETRFAYGISLVWALLYNLPFWERTFAAMWHPTIGGIAFLVSLFVLVLNLQAMLLLMMPTAIGMRIAATALFIVAAASSYFTAEYGTIMNKDMLRNVLETDPAEVSDLINIHLLAVMAVLGLLPAALIWRVSMPTLTWQARLRQRGAALSIAVLLCLGCLFASSADYAVFFRQHKPVRFTLAPFAPVTSLAELASHGDRRHGKGPLSNPAGQTQRVGTPHARPLVLFLVIGETARAANFSLSGYARPTNPELTTIEDLVYFDHASACGTSTALSVPCMFSHLTRVDFDTDDAGRFTNLLDALTAGGLDVEWRDNNAGCKGVCARVRSLRYAGRKDDALCPHAYCYDEVMLRDLAERLDHIERDTLIVFHQIGSHGPAYAERYPPEFERFKPACRSNELQHCTQQEIVNAYDNTIAYTDHVLARQIGLLRRASNHLDSALLYASDHGESLGEQGIYLHGLPYRFAPEVQTQVPMLMWTSIGYRQRTGLDFKCLRTRASTEFSHDHIYHTVLGAAELRNQAYDAKLDILAACRGMKAGE
jgi:lipid A ethanolaminephosphotransferase